MEKELSCLRGGGLSQAGTQMGIPHDLIQGQFQSLVSKGTWANAFSPPLMTKLSREQPLQHKRFFFFFYLTWENACVNRLHLK